MLKTLTVLLVLASANVSAATASYYGKPFHGRKTASGETYNMHAMTAAHMTLPFGTRVLVTNLTNKKAVTVKINDRGNFAKYGRAIDLSKGASDKINCNLCKVSLKILK